MISNGEAIIINLVSGDGNLSDAPLMGASDAYNLNLYLTIAQSFNFIVREL